MDGLLAELGTYSDEVDRELVTRAYRFAAAAHKGQQRRSGEPFITHPVGVATICAQLRLDEQTIAAALLHDVVEDTDTDLAAVREEFGDEVAALVDGVTKLTRVQFQSREQAEAENYRKMVVAMAEDVRVILVKLADRLHNLRTIEYLGKQKQVQKSKEALEVYAPLAHRLGIHALKWELEDLAFQTLHPRKYEEIKQMVAERRADREGHVAEAADVLRRELEKVDIPAEISGRAKHFYSIYDKMAKKGREFNEIYDLTAMRVIVERDGEEGTRDCYGGLGLIHSLWKPMPGRFKDYVAMPKFNGYRSLHTTVIGPEGRPLEIQVRTREMHETAELGVAAHWSYKRDGRSSKTADAEWSAWVRQLMDIHADEADAREFVKSFRTDLFDEEVFVFTPKGEVKTLPAGATPIDFAYAVHTDVGHRTVGAKVNGRIVPLHYKLRSGDRVEILTAKTGRGPSRDWLSLVQSSRARNKIRQFFSREQKEDLEAKGREALEHALKAQNLPYKKLAGSAVLAGVIRETGFKKAEDFYLALGSGKLTAGSIVNKVLQQLKVEEVAAEEPVVRKKPKARDALASNTYGIKVIGVEDVLVRLAKCCTPVPGDAIVGYISLGKGITIHRDDCPNVRALRRNPERFTPVEWEGGVSQSFRVQIAVDSWDRPRLLEDVARTFAEHGANIVSYGGTVEDQMARNWYVVEVGDVKGMRALLASLRNVESVFDAYRVTPS
ncbi:MAG: bifunctional (p)ppGpp synthetase/guanosine-3',5'-bis(diphosphate) 3'-pyrophosphohydrolase [Actinobacteria bacterium]|nr:bifunctional (p)ppGpp synthetase/guanosine-3',5'-bis(diphosphate) 3'-pyrophosphohydrolase [Actinomycetota bacterium]MBV8561577.1 bifunctional (p)ppGpp synthetase/guanosine-3',5'-bis(diphosphate) 3'-pyrophosphohydrolase [Actinomycetota bacterium]